jgi:3-hydroxyisobutyrate dehydrogenase
VAARPRCALGGASASASPRRGVAGPNERPTTAAPGPPRAGVELHLKARAAFERERVQCRPLCATRASPHTRAVQRVGVIGIGNMGLAMALRLLDRGFDVTVRDLVAAREGQARAAGAAVAATPAQLGARSDAVIVVVVDAAQSEAVLFGPGGAAAALQAGQALLLCPTIAPEDAERLLARVAQTGADAIEAPMSGGPTRAREGRMSLMVACDDAAHRRWQALLEAIADPVFRVGPRLGDGARTKLVNNLLAAVNLAGAAEALALAERVGLDPARVQAVIERSSGQSWIGSDRMTRALQGELAPRAHTTLLRKDSALAIAMAEAAGVDAALGRVAADVFAAACEAGHAADDDASLWPFLRARAARTASGSALDGDPPRLDAALASVYALSALRALATAYPYALQHTMHAADDRPRPEEAHPLFHGSWDWHSSVHMQASLVRILRDFPALPERGEIEAVFAARHRPEGIARELAYLQAHPGFERPYGWAWLLRLQDELDALWPARAAALEPLAALVRARWLAHLAQAPHAQRAGVHANSAFAMTLALAHARRRGDDAFASALAAAARRWYGGDRRYPADYEPSANDFLSPGLCAAVLMQQVEGGEGFERWWRDYRPAPSAFARWLAPAAVASRTDGQLVHADGLNLSRAWCLGRLAAALPSERARLEAARRAHLAAALPHVTGGDFVATHWLVSFALLALADDAPAA